MDWISDTLASFGASIGIPSLAFDDEGIVQFALESGGALCIQRLPDMDSADMLVSACNPLHRHAGPILRGALRLADFRSASSWQTQVSVRNGNLVITLRIPKHSFVLSSLEDAVTELFRLHDVAAQTY